MKKYYVHLILSVFILSFLQINSCKSKKATGCDCENDVTATKEFVLSSVNTEVNFDTYEYSGEFNADGACHAVMDLSFRWADPDFAKTNPNRPPINYEFQSLFAWFPTNQSMEYTFHDGDDLLLWTITVSEAIDKNKPEGSSYGINVKWVGTGDENNGGNTDVLCKIHIEYKVFSESAYIDGCTVSDND